MAKYEDKIAYAERLERGHCVCSICGIDKPITEFEKTNRGRYSYRCKKCKTQKSKERQRFYAEQFRAMKQAIGCARCGEDDPYCLHFHHIDPQEKKYCVGIKGRSSFRSMEDEVAKCILLCANCHAKLEAGRFILEDILNGN